MEKYKTIEEYVVSDMGDKVTRKAKSPLLGLFILSVGIGLTVLLSIVPMGDVLQSVCLTFGIIGAVLGIILTGMCLSKTLTYYFYNPTHSRMKQRKCYLNTFDYQIALDAIRDNKANILGTLLPVTSSNSALNLLYSRDHSIALLQAVRDNSGHFEPETPVLCLTGTEVTHIQTLCK